MPAYHAKFVSREGDALYSEPMPSPEAAAQHAAETILAHPERCVLVQANGIVRPAGAADADAGFTVVKAR